MFPANLIWHQNSMTMIAAVVVPALLAAALALTLLSTHRMRHLDILRS